MQLAAGGTAPVVSTESTDRVPPKKKRGKRSMFATLSRQEGGTVRRAERIIARAEQEAAQELEEDCSARARSTTEVKGPRKARRVRRQHHQKQEHSRPPLQRRVPEREKAQSPPRQTVRLHSVAPELKRRRERAEDLRAGIQEAKDKWKTHRFWQRKALVGIAAKKSPKGSIRRSIIASLPPLRSSCDEQTKANGPVADN